MDDRDDKVARDLNEAGLDDMCAGSTGILRAAGERSCQGLLWP
jgi:hypothetical protein